MSDAHAFDFGKFIPGFDFLQKLATSRPAGATAVPGLGGWVAPTVSVDELERRIKELKAVQFWLDQNATAIKATIQALEVQKMTLATLQSMNVSVAEVAKAFTLPTGDAPAPASSAPAAAPEAAAGWPFTPTAAHATVASPAAEPEPEPAQPEPPAVASPAPEKSQTAKPKAARKSDAKAAAPQSGVAGGVADPLQWWGALTQQFQQIAANALREGARQPPEAGGLGAGKVASKSVAVSAEPVSAKAAKSAKSTKPAAGAAKKVAAKKPAAKKAAKPRASAKKSAPRTAAAAAPTAGKGSAQRPTLAGWPLPPPFKLSR